MPNIFRCEVGVKMASMWSDNWISKCECWCERRTTDFSHKYFLGIIVVTFQFFNIVIHLSLYLLLRFSTIRIRSCCYWHYRNVYENCTLVCLGYNLQLRKICYFVTVPVMNHLWRYHSEEDILRASSWSSVIIPR